MKRSRSFGQRAPALSLLAALALAHALAGQAPPSRADSAALYLQATARRVRADSLRALGASDRLAALQLYEDAARFYGQAGAARDRAAALTNVGTLFGSLGHPDSALRYDRQAAAAYQSMNDQPGEGAVLHNIGRVYADIGQPDSALKYLRLALPMRRASGDRTGEAQTLNNIGIVFAHTGQGDSALAYYREALPLSHAAPDRSTEASVVNNIGGLFLTGGRPDSALAYYRQAATLYHGAGLRADEGRELSNIGVVFGGTGRTDSALAYYAAALVIRRAVGDRAGVAATLSNLGLALEGMGQPDSALAGFREALALRRAVGDRAGEAVTLGDIGSLFADTGRPDSALAYEQAALPIRRAVGDRDGEATTLTDLGHVFRDIGQPDSALAYYRRALPIRRAVGDSDGEAGTLNNIGQVFDDVPSPDSALQYYRQAESLYRVVGDQANDARTLSNIGIVLDRAGQLDAALAYHRRALQISRAAEDRFGEADALGNIGQVQRDANRPDSSLVYFRLALPILRAAGDLAGQALMFTDIGALFRDLGRLDSAIANFDRAAALYAGISKHAGSDFNQLSYNQTTADAYAYWTLSWLGVARGGDRAAAAHAAYAALGAAERGRAQALRQLMGTSREIAPGADVAGEAAQSAARVLRSAAAALVYSAAGDTLITWLVRADGSIIASEQPVAAARLDTLVAAFRYGVADEDSRSNRGRGITRSGSAALDPLDPGILTDDVVKRAAADSGRAVRREMAAILLPAEIRSRLPSSGELVVVPYGGLGLIPFGLLPVDSGSGALLGDRLALRYGPSLEAIADAGDRPSLASSPGAPDRAHQLVPALIVGDPTMPPPFTIDGQTYELADLPGAATEAGAVAAALGDPTWLTGDAANISMVSGLMPAARLIHLATHGMVFSSDANARKSFVALAPDAAHHRDGQLTVATIVDSLTFRAELVVLSACQTAVGNVKSAEGTLGLQRAVLGKGARSVLVSLWNVNDAATLFLIERFYEHWLHDPAQPSKSEALRLAEVDMRAEAARNPVHRAWADPFYWAAFQLVGAP